MRNLPMVSLKGPDDRLREIDMPAPGAEWTTHIPVSVNDTYGDPFIPEQVGNTVAKLNLLGAQRRPTAIFTKAGPNQQVLAALGAVEDPRRVIVFYSLTGLDEGGISFTERSQTISNLKKIFPHVMILARPIIAGRNDSEENLARLVATAHTEGIPFVLGGVHDQNKKKKLAGSVEEKLLQLCREQDVPAFFKTSCAAAWATQQDCWVHEFTGPHWLEEVCQLGYEASVSDDGGVVLPQGTTGDINFLRMLCRSEIYVEQIVSNYNVLSMSLVPGILLEATSSWFAWSENIEVCLDCDYCIIRQIEYLRRDRVSVGVHPSRLLDAVDQKNGQLTLERLRGRKIGRTEDRSKLHRYGDLRVTKPCYAHLYAHPGDPA